MMLSSFSCIILLVLSYLFTLFVLTIISSNLCGIWGTKEDDSSLPTSLTWSEDEKKARREGRIKTLLVVASTSTSTSNCSPRMFLA